MRKTATFLRVARPVKRPMWVRDRHLKAYITVLGAAVILASPLWGYALFVSTGFDMSLALVIVPVLVAVNYFLVAHVTRRDAWFRQLMIVSLIVKIASAGLFTYIAFRVYDAASDVAL